MEQENVHPKSLAPGSPSPTPPAEPDPRVEDWLDRACAPLVGLAPYRVRQELRRQYRARLEALVAEQRGAGHPPDEAIARALKQAGKPARMSRTHVTEWQVARGSVWPAMRAALVCFAVPWFLVTVPHVLPMTWRYLLHDLVGWNHWGVGVSWLIDRYALLAVFGTPIVLGALAGVLGGRRQALGTLYVLGCLSAISSLGFCWYDRGFPQGMLNAAPLMLLVILGTAGAAAGAAIRDRLLARAGSLRTTPADEPLRAADRIEDYLDRVCAPLVGMMPHGRRVEIRQELSAHLDSLTAAYQELGHSPGEAASKAIWRCGDPRRVARAWEEAWADRGSSARRWRTTLVALAVFSLALAVWRYPLHYAGSLVWLGWPPGTPGHWPLWRYAWQEGVRAIDAALPLCAGLAVWRLAPGRAPGGVVCALALMAGAIETAAWLAGDGTGYLRSIAREVLLLRWLPVAVLAAGIPGWARRIQWWLATKDRPLSA